MVRAPQKFHGTLSDLYQDHMQRMLPDLAEVNRFHKWMGQYCLERSPVFPVRAVTGAERQRIYSTSDGTLIAPADNSPAWVVHARLVLHQLSSFNDFHDLMLNMPTHMFEIRRSIGETANDYGWYVAHILRTKNGHTRFNNWTRAEVEQRFYRTLHPCNVFFVPGVRNRRIGEDPKVIQYVAQQYAARYGSTWSDFLVRAGATLDFSDPNLGTSIIDFDITTETKSSTRTGVGAPPRLDRVAVSYRASRLTFKRHCIEPLAPDEVFEVVTPMGVYRFTKSQFYSAFPNIPRTASYREHGLYHGAQLHLKAARFRVSGE